MNPLEIEDIYPLSPMQEGMIFHTLLEPESQVYFRRLTCRLEGDLDTEAFARVWQQAVDRNPILRTSFLVEDVDEPLQVVHRNVELPFNLLDWRDCSPEEQEARWAALLKSDLERGFDLATAPLMRLSLARVGAQSLRLAWTYHHLIMDGWSLALLFDEIFELFGAAATGTAPNLPQRRPYRDYIAWLGNRDLVGSEAYWRRTLSGFTEPSPVSGGDRESAGGERFAERRHVFSKAESGEIQGAARDLQATLSTLLQGAWALVLAADLGSDDVVFGATVSGRPTDLEGFESMVGLFINTLPVRVRIDREAVLSSWLRTLQAEQAEARQHEHCSLAKVQSWSQVPRGTPLFQSILSVQNLPGRGSNDGALEIRGPQVVDVEHPDASNYKYTLIGIPGECLELRLLYDGARFCAQETDRRLGHVARLLKEMAAVPSLRLGSLSILAPAEVHQIIFEWNDTDREFSGATTLVGCFETIVAASPDSVALSFGDFALSYGELGRRAGRLANRLRAFGAGPDTCVGLCVERSPELVIGLLGIVAAGGAYVPLNPADPLERLDALLRDAGISIVVAQRDLADRLPASSSLLVVEVEDPGLRAESEGIPIAGTDADNLAYVLFTSGSTGKPKGVSVSQRAVLRLVMAGEFVSWSKSAVFLQLAPIPFDASTFELWGCLLHGARLVLMPPGAPSMESLAEALERERVTHLFLTTSLFNVFVDRRVESLRGLRHLLFGGDVVSPARVAQVREALPGLDLVNCYGPTETTTFATCGSMASSVEREGPLSIGRGIAKTSLFVWNRVQEPVAIGIPGELCIGGEGVARGYLNRPELTAERFIPNPLGGSPGQRVYRTGDQVRWFTDGRLEFLGRLDHQVKIRGFRIEPGEIEAALGEHPDVRQAVVLAFDDGVGDKRLVAYFVAAGGSLPAIEDLRRHLGQKLPSYMVPSHFTALAALPLSAHGKVDRKKLGAPGSERPELGEAFVAPRSPRERILAEIWAEVLNLESVGINDNFFNLGGDSIRSIEVLARAQQQGLHFTLQQLFDHQTVSGLIREIDAAAVSSEASESVIETEPFGLISSTLRALVPDSAEDAYPLAAMQAGMIFHSELGRGTAIYVEMVSYHLRAPYDPEALTAALERVVARHPMLRTAFDLELDGGPLQLVHRAVEVPIVFEDLRAMPASLQTETLDAWLASQSTAAFDYRRPPLFRFNVHRRTDESFQLTLAFHHAILDGWSVGLLLTEMFRFYLKGIGQVSEPLKPPPVLTYRDFMALEIAARESAEHRLFWREKLAAIVPTSVPRWPKAQRPVPKNEEIALVLGGEAVPGLFRASAAAEVPLKSVLLAAHLCALGVITGQERVTSGFVVNGRPEAPDGERIIGLFLNTLPITQGVEGGTWIELAGQTFAAEREIWSHRRYPLAELQRQRPGTALFEANFNFVHFHIYEGVQRNGGVEVLEGASYAETNFPFAANCQLDEAHGFLKVSLIYHASEFGRPEVEAIAEIYRRILGAIGSNAKGRYDVVPLLDSEQEQLIADWNRTEVGYPPEMTNEVTIDELVARQAARAPERVALWVEGREISYRELMSLAARMGAYLQGQGATVDAPVGIFLDRSLDAIVAILGVLRAGAAFVPLDPSLPPRRLLAMLEDLKPAIVVTRSGLAERLPETKARLVVVDTEAEAIEGLSDRSLSARALADNLAYVIFTSGSTGRPKAVMVSHRAIGNRLLWMQKVHPIGPDDGVMLKTPLHFDASVWEMFLPLMVGARTIVVRPEGHRDPGHLLAEIKARCATVLQVVPSLLPSLLDHPDSENLGALRRLFCGGEPLPIDLVDRFLARFGGEMHNLYGPTETAIDATCWTCSQELGVVAPIGRPLANLRIHLFDPRLQPVPIGTFGEVFVAGQGLARGYCGRSDSTAERFVPNNLATSPGERLYRTGDLARWRPDGVLEYGGRVDLQVKVRGVRIEPADIETALRRHPRVREAVVATREDSTGGRRLVAYVVAAEDSERGGPNEEELNAHLRGELPEVMIPAAILVLDGMPLTATGKLDRAALPVPDWDRRPTGRPRVSPRTPIERVLAEIWSEVLGAEGIGVHDSFFDLGGHSLQALTVVARVRRSFGVELPLGRLFDEPTLESIALVVTELVTDRLEQLSEEEAGRLLANLEGEMASAPSFAEERE